MFPDVDVAVSALIILDCWLPFCLSLSFSFLPFSLPSFIALHHSLFLRFLLVVFLGFSFTHCCRSNAAVGADLFTFALFSCLSVFLGFSSARVLYVCLFWHWRSTCLPGPQFQSKNRASFGNGLCLPLRRRCTGGTSRATRAGTGKRSQRIWVARNLRATMVCVEAPSRLLSSQTVYLNTSGQVAKQLGSRTEPCGPPSPSPCSWRQSNLRPPAGISTLMAQIICQKGSASNQHPVGFWNVVMNHIWKSRFLLPPAPDLQQCAIASRRRPTDITMYKHRKEFQLRPVPNNERLYLETCASVQVQV